MKNPADRIHVRDLLVRCIVGIYPDERREKQDVILNITMHCDCAPAARSDRIEDAVDYKRIKKKILAMVEASDFNLIETMADRVAALCLEHPGVACVTVCVDKPGALRFARSVAVEVTRVRTPSEP